MPEHDRQRYIFDTFLEFFPGWKEHIEDYKGVDPYTIDVIFKKDGYTTSGKVYTFGDDGCDNWHLEMDEGGKKHGHVQ